MFMIEDVSHAELQTGEFSTRQDAIDELRGRAGIAWDQSPNRAPCTSWRTCGRRYKLIEYNTAAQPWTIVSREPLLEVSAGGVVWVSGENGG